MVIDTDNLTRLATMYYVDGLTQEELSRQFSISRATVGRMLRRAQEDGIVEIRVRPQAAYSADLQRQLIERFGVQRALIAVDHDDADRQRELLAGIVAAYLDRTVSDDSIVAVGMGRNVSAVSEHAMSAVPRSCTFVSAIGGSYRGGATMNADHIARRLAARFGGESQTLYAPALIGDPALRDVLLANDTVRHALGKARRADLALVGVGDISESSNMMRMGWFTPEEVAQAKRRGCVGDLMGYDFIDIHGMPSAIGMQGRVIGLTLPDLQRIPNVVAVASESSKVAAILGVLRAGVVNTLATTAANALAVLSLDTAMQVPR